MDGSPGDTKKALRRPISEELGLALQSVVLAGACSLWVTYVLGSLVPVLEAIHVQAPYGTLTPFGIPVVLLALAAGAWGPWRWRNIKFEGTVTDVYWGFEGSDQFHLRMADIGSVKCGIVTTVATRSGREVKLPTPWLLQPAGKNFEPLLRLSSLPVRRSYPIVWQAGLALMLAMPGAVEAARPSHRLLETDPDLAREKQALSMPISGVGALVYTAGMLGAMSLLMTVPPGKGRDLPKL